ncbi:DUF1989 domain-containing protein [Rubellimicrobium arenae]|uniref:DUF1989 domain-containing protein n=1 Tax=Rubellimicrobium arenae TaxID=2817372 RepID=UPI001B310E9A|nr:DUF1989 domain-containing protein [Rubellimicrobium arenae]
MPRRRSRRAGHFATRQARAGLQGADLLTTDPGTVPARRSRAARLSAGQALRIVNTHGQQVVDTLRRTWSRSTERRASRPRFISRFWTDWRRTGQACPPMNLFGPP